MTFCSSCGNKVSDPVFKGDRSTPFVCFRCGLVHRSQPRLIVGCLPVYKDRILLCRRAIEPRKGYWTLPAGFMENGETSVQGAARETWEEARARVTRLVLYRLIDVPHMAQVHLFYRCRLPGGVYGVGPESSECALFKQEDIPWGELAFPLLRETLLDYFSDAAVGRFPFKVVTSSSHTNEPSFVNNRKAMNSGG